MRKMSKLLTSRMFFSGIIMIMQFALIAVAAHYLNEKFPVFYAAMGILALVFVFFLVNADMNPWYKIPWIIIVLALPVFGVITYVLFGRNDKRNRRFMRYVNARLSVHDLIAEHKDDVAALQQEDGFFHRTTRYVCAGAGYPVSSGNTARYFGCGEEFYPVLLQKLQGAKKFIFLEYFIIDFGKVWSEILAVLRKKVKEGVDVRLIYDDFGNFRNLPARYYKELEGYGIKTMVFNPFRPILDMRGNNRSHRKIAVIDGEFAFTGGINLADEYVNEIERCGYWKDTAVMLQGPAVDNFTAMFLQMWSVKYPREEYAKFFGFATECAGDCYAQPYSDAPQDATNICENIYLSIIYNAKDYVYITTPYLMIDNEMKVALLTAAQSGVDVRIIVPHVPDKRIAFWLTKAFYTELLKGGVRIYEYLPGFIHAKQIVSDDEYAVVGTSNMDFRSFYLQFECGVFLKGKKIAGEIVDDLQKTCDLSQEMTVESTKVHLPMRIIRGILRFFAPLM